MCKYCEIDEENFTNEAKRNIRKNQRVTVKIVRNVCNKNLYYLSVDTNSYKKEVIDINYCPMCRKEARRVKTILDACCGSKMFWFDKDNKNTVYMDNRELTDILCDGRKLEIKPDIVADFRNIPFKDKSFYLVIFDPPHLLKIGETSYMAKKYGKLTDTWKEDIKQGFKECMRVLKTHGILIFKWNEQQIKLKEILNIIDYRPLLGNRRDKTHWLVFMKEDEQ